MIAAIALAYRSKLRRRWRSWLAVALLVAIIGGTVTGLVAAGRRTALVIGVPLGLAARHLAWDVTATDFGVVPSWSSPPSKWSRSSWARSLP